MLEPEKHYFTERFTGVKLGGKLVGWSKHLDNWQAINHIHPSCLITRLTGISGDGGVFIGPRTVLSPSCSIVSSQTAFAVSNQKASFGDVIIGSDVVIERNTIVLPGSVIPDNATVNRGNAHTFVNKESNWSKINVEFSAPHPPVFILSTGRSGSTSIAHAVNASEEYLGKHESIKALTLGGYLADHLPEVYQAYKESFSNRLLLAAAISAPKILVESDQRLYNQIPLLTSLFPLAKFIHLKRNFDSWEMSASRKGWYEPNDFHHIWERFRPHPSGELQRWKNLSRREKRRWYFNTVNDTITDQLRYLDEQQQLTVNLMQSDRDEEISRFLKCPIQMPQKNQGT